ncbi:MAG: helix-turn-helix domain-containing protein [Oscillospiraceae bacterium]|jgi:transcriptional regulator with XRE-family HTH domain|nr:helix-turn-helix domain-containing protein [Oscillospiraceae bacterium]
MDIGNIIKKLRRERNYTQEELAELLCVTPQAVSKWENGTGLPDISQIVPLASVFGVSTDVLFGTYGVNDDEETQRLYDAAFEPLKSGDKHIGEVYDAVVDVLRRFPNNFRLLDDCVGYLCNLAMDYHKEGHARADEVYAECERVANLIIGYDRDAGHIARAQYCLADMYLSFGQFGKAEEHARLIPKVWNSAHDMLAQVKQAAGDIDGAIAGFCNLVRFRLNDLGNAVTRLGGAYFEAGQYEDAIRVYEVMNGLRGVIYGDDEFTPTHHDVDAYIARCRYMLGDYDGALDALERRFEYDLSQERHYNKTKRVETPLLRECVWDYFFDSASAKESAQIALGGEWFGFDAIREEPRFRALVEQLTMNN